MNRADRIAKSLSQLDPIALEVVDESHMHSGNRVESHFKVLVVSEAFAGNSRVQRQRIVNDLLKDEFNVGLHALSLRCLTPEEASGQGIEFNSPQCASSKTPADS